MLHTLTIKDQPLWNIQSFTADVAACFGVHADRYLEEPKTFSDISLKPSETTVNASINWMPDINQGLRQLLAISTVKLLNLPEQRHLLGEIWHPSSLPYFKNLPALWTIKNAKGPYYTGTNLNIEMLRAAINGHCTIYYPLCKKQSG